MKWTRKKEEKDKRKKFLYANKDRDFAAVTTTSNFSKQWYYRVLE